MSKSVEMRVNKKGNDNTSVEPYTSDASRKARSFLEKLMGEMSKTSAMKQILIGSTSGWATGLITMKIGKITACAVGGGIIMLQIAVHQGYININWDKVITKAEKITDKVEEQITGEGPHFMDKVGNIWRANSYMATSFLGGFIIGLSW